MNIILNKLLKSEFQTVENDSSVNGKYLATLLEACKKNCKAVHTYGTAEGTETVFKLSGHTVVFKADDRANVREAYIV